MLSVPKSNKSHIQTVCNPRMNSAGSSFFFLPMAFDDPMCTYKCLARYFFLSVTFLYLLGFLNFLQCEAATEQTLWVLIKMRTLKQTAVSNTSSCAVCSFAADAFAMINTPTAGSLESLAACVYAANSSLQCLFIGRWEQRKPYWCPPKCWHNGVRSPFVYFS